MANDKREPKKWTMPEWMEPYRSSFYSTGGNTVEELMDAPNENPHLSQTNAVLFALSMMAEAQVALLTILHRDGKLATAEGIPQSDRWVDVADRLPDGDFTEYLICLENKSVFRATYLGKKEWLVAGVGSVKDHNPVIAWQPLPAPYQRQSSEGE